VNLFQITAVQGTDHAFTVDASGGTFIGSEALTAVVTRGDGQAALLSLTPAWSDATEGQATLSLSTANLATLTPGPYLVLVKADAVLIAIGQLAVVPNVGVGTPARALVTPAEAIGLIPALATDQDGFNMLPFVLEAATRRCEEYCGRELVLSSFDRLYSLNQNSAIILHSRPVPVVSRCQTALGVGIEIRYTGAAEQATVTVAPTTPDVLTVSALTLKSVASGVETTTTLTLSTYVTIADLVAAIVAVTGWTASTFYGTTATTELFGTPGIFGAKAATVTIPIYSQQVYQYFVDTFRGRIEFDPGILSTSSYLPNDFRQYGVRIAYRAGFAYLAADLTAGYAPAPADLKIACVMTARALLDSADQTGLVKSQTVKDRSYTVNTEAVAIPPVAASILASYMDAI
jgi:hypothetical protein